MGKVEFGKESKIFISILKKNANIDNIRAIYSEQCTYHFNFRDYRITIRTKYPIQTSKYEKNIYFILKGRIYPNNHLSVKNYIISSYKKHGQNFINYIHGSFLIILIDKNQQKLFIITDRLNSFKLFYVKSKNGYSFSDTIYDLKDLAKEISANEILLYLSNGFIFNSNSLIKDIKVTTHSTSFVLKNDSLTEKKYWIPKFIYSSSHESISNLKNRLYELLVNSVSKRLSDDKETILSLSGGYDISAILGILKYELDYSSIKCYSYYYNEIKKLSDVDIAKKQSEKCGYYFNYLKSFEGNLLSHIRYNSILGQGISNYCEELDFWIKMAKEKESGKGAIFFGDEFFGFNSRLINKKNYLENFLKIYDLGILSSLKGVFTNYGLNLLKSSPRFYPDNEQLIVHSNDSSVFYDELSILYYNLRLTTIMTSWREFFPSRNYEILNPLLDEELIDFTLNLPPLYRKNKFLFKSTITEKIPEIFKIPRAKYSNNIANWPKIIHDNSKELKTELIKPNPIDFIVNQKKIYELLSDQTLLPNKKKNIEHFSKIMDRLNLQPKSINYYQFILRYFTIRFFYEEYYQL